MPLDDKAVLADMLGVAAPWSVSDVQIAHGTRTVTLTIEQSEPPARFWSRREAAPVRRRLRWDHMSLAGMRCQVIVGLRDGQVPPAGAPWVGEQELPFTNGLSRLVLDLLLAGATIDQLCVLLRVPFADLWRYKFRLDQGNAQAAPPTTVGTVAASASAPRPIPAQLPPGAFATAAPAGLPAEDSVLWMTLLLGRLNLDVRTLSLKLLLTKLQTEARQHQDPDLHRHAAQSLYRYFAKNHTMLAFEVAQLRALAPSPVPPPAAATSARLHDGAVAAMPPVPSVADPDALPDASDPLWLALLQGQRDLDVRTLSLKLLLTKLRSQINVIHDDDVRMLKLVELHRFFERHRAMLGHEIAQINRWTLH